MLHLKYRPSKLKDIHGNDETIKSLKSILKRDDRKSIPHAFMFVGQRGCGKTSIARIVAWMLGVAPEDVEEVNAALVNGTDDAKAIVRKMNLAPRFGKYKCVIFDEAQQLTNAAQNVLLKPFEDTPQHVYFFICTTDPQKIIKTLRSRCTTYEMKLLEEDELVELLTGVSKSEGVKVPKDVLEIIARNALGSPREALVLLDQIIDLDKEAMRETVEKAAARESRTIELCQALMKRAAWKVITNIIKNMDEDPETVRRAVLGYFTSVILNANNPNAALMLACFSEPYFNTGKAGLVLSCYEAIAAK